LEGATPFGGIDGLGGEMYTVLIRFHEPRHSFARRPAPRVPNRNLEAHISFYYYPTMDMRTTRIFSPAVRKNRDAPS
jgi:hypothetical protein